MIYQALADKVIIALNSMRPLQREGVRRSITAPNFALPENVALWEAILPGMNQDKDADDTEVPLLRTALETLPLDSWRVINDCIFV